MIEYSLVFSYEIHWHNLDTSIIKRSEIFFRGAYTKTKRNPLSDFA